MTDAMGAVKSALSGVDYCYPINEVPDAEAYPYNVYSATLGRGDSYTLDSREGVRWGRVVVQTVARTGTTALAHAEAVRAALVGKALTITGYETTPCRAELDPQMVRDPDDQGVVSVTATYIFTATRKATP